MSDDDEERGEGLFESFEDKVFVGDCISFFIEGTKTEAQGVVIKIYRDENDVDWFEVNVMRRAPPSKEWDIENKSTRVYRCFDTDERVWVMTSLLVDTIPLEFIEGSEKLDKSLIYDAYPLQARKLMLYYMKGPGGVPGTSMPFKLSWWHFDPSSLSTLDWKQRRCVAMNDEDLTSRFVCLLKPLIFDPFVSVLSYSHRHPPKHWNIRTWKLLLRNSVEPVVGFDSEMERLQRNTSCDMVFREEVFISNDCIRIIRILLKEWMNAPHAEMSPYEARTFMDHHEKFVSKSVDIIMRQKEKEERDESSGSDDSDLDEHMSFGGDSTDTGEL